MKHFRVRIHLPKVRRARIKYYNGGPPPPREEAMGWGNNTWEWPYVAVYVLT